MKTWLGGLALILVLFIIWLVVIAFRPAVGVTPTGGITTPDHPATVPVAGTPPAGPVVSTGTTAPVTVPGPASQVPIKRIRVSRVTPGLMGQQTFQIGELYVYSGGALLTRQDFSDASHIDKTPADVKNAWPAWNMVDGNLRTFVHTASPDDTQGVELTLAQPRPIEKIIVFNRADCCQDRLAGAILQLFDESGASVYSATLTKEMQQTLIR